MIRRRVSSTGLLHLTGQSTIDVAQGRGRRTAGTGDRVGAATPAAGPIHLDRLDRCTPSMTAACRAASPTIGAAVIGTGFIGTVHVEAAAPDRRPGPRRPRQHPGAWRRAGRRARRRAGVPDRSTTLLADPTVDVVHVTSPNDLHVRAGAGDPRRRQARRLREAAGDDRRRVGRAASRWPRATGARQRRQLQHPLLPAQPARPRGRGRRRASATSGSSPGATSRTGCSSRPTGTGGSSPIAAAPCARSATSARTGST